MNGCVTSISCICTMIHSLIKVLMSHLTQNTSFRRRSSQAISWLTTENNKSSAVAGMGNRLTTIDMGRKVGAAVPLSVAELHQSPPETMLPGLRPTSVPSGILIHPAIWPQQTWAKMGGGCSPFGGEGELHTHLTQCGLSRGLPPYQVAS